MHVRLFRYEEMQKTPMHTHGSAKTPTSMESPPGCVSSNSSNCPAPSRPPPDRNPCPELSTTLATQSALSHVADGMR